jgi:amino acid permease
MASTRHIAVLLLWAFAYAPASAKTYFTANPFWLYQRPAPLSTAGTELGARHHVSVSSTWLAMRGGGGGGSKRDLPPNDSSQTGASTAMMTFNLVKGILGSGILALPSGIATITSSSDGSAGNAVLAPAVLLLALTGLVSAYGFTLIGLICDATGATTYREAWIFALGELPIGRKSTRSSSERALALRSKTSWMPAVACLAVTFCTTLTYTMVIADMLPQLLPVPMSRATSLLSLAIILAPICLMQELKKLAPVSIVGLIGTIYTALAMAFRWYQHSEKQQRALKSLSLSGLWSTLQSPALFLGMLSTSFMSHYNAPRVYWELRGADPSTQQHPSGQSLSKFATVVRYGFGAATIVMAIIATSGYAVYGKSSASNILTSYPLSDKLMSLSRAAIAISLICTFPLAFVGIRNQFLELFGLSRTSPSVTTTVTFGLLALLVVVAYFVRDLRIVLAVGGKFALFTLFSRSPSISPLFMISQEVHGGTQSSTCFLRSCCFTQRLNTPSCCKHTCRLLR